MSPEPPITPLHIPAATRDILLVGGTFDPPHAAHAAMALAAADWIDSARSREARSHRSTEPRRLGSVTRCETGQIPDPGEHQASIVLVPAARSPFKPPPLAPDDARVGMLHALAQHIAAQSPGPTPRACTVWTDELDRAARAGPPAPSYWIDTLRRAHAALAPRLGTSHPLPQLHFLIGADQAIVLHRWRDPRAILELARPVIALRPPIDDKPTLARALQAAAYWNNHEIIHLTAFALPTPLSPINATAIREALAAGTDPPADWLPPPVADAISRRNLYASKAGPRP